MSIEQKDPIAAKGIVDQNAGAIYVDVRTPAEFERGHPVGAINIPIMLQSGGGMAPNVAAFQKVAEAVLPKDKPLVMGCQMGGRSQRAAELLSSWGYPELYNVSGGYAAWTAAGLPVSTVVSDDASYAALLARV